MHACCSISFIDLPPIISVVVAAVVPAKGIADANIAIGLELDHLTAFPYRLFAHSFIDSREGVVCNAEIHC
jgi:hypothetical protein